MYLFPGCWGVRHTFVILAFLGCANVYAMRVNLSVAIVAMVDNTLSGKSTLIHNSYFSIFYIRKDLEKVTYFSGNTENETQLGYQCPFPKQQQNTENQSINQVMIF